MKQITKKFFHKGTDRQTRADIIFDVRRIDVDKIRTWSAGEKLLAKAFLNDIESSFKDFVKMARAAL